MRALVVGASGFIGGAVARLLDAEGWDVVTLSRRGISPCGTALSGDVTRPDLGLDSVRLDELSGSVTHIVSTFGSVEWVAGPRTAVDVHQAGTRNLLRLAERCTRLERYVHVSSVLALGRAEGRLGNRDLDVGQSFRTWYEYGKYLAERCLRDALDVPRRAVRLGPMLGVGADGPPEVDHGLLAVLPFLLRGYPTHLGGGGEFPCYVGELGAAAQVVRTAMVTPGDDLTWTWFDPDLPSLARVLTELCEPRGQQPRIVDARFLNTMLGAVAPRVGLPRLLTAYVEPWMDIDPAVLDTIPGGAPRCPDGYIRATGAALGAPRRPLLGVYARV